MDLTKYKNQAGSECLGAVEKEPETVTRRRIATIMT